MMPQIYSVLATVIFTAVATTVILPIVKAVFGPGRHRPERKA